MIRDGCWSRRGVLLRAACGKDCWDLFDGKHSSSVGEEAMKDTDMIRGQRTPHNIRTLMGLIAKSICISMVVLMTADNRGYALDMAKMPKENQTTNAQPEMRTISVKLPLRQTEHHWTFMHREDILAGRLVLRIIRGGQTNEIVIFSSGKMSEGWEPMAFPIPKAGEIYFEFNSSSKYETAPNDRVELELNVKQDVDGIGPTQTGVLRAGTYKTDGDYSGLLDGYKIPEQFKAFPKETIDKLRKQFEFKAFLESWQEQWDLRITSGQGWLSQ